MKTHQIAAQLYTCRRLLQTPADIATTLRRVRQAGYQAVQLSGLGPIPHTELNAILDGEGLVCCATHEPSATILDEPNKVVETLAALRCTTTAYPFPGGVDFADESSVQELIEKLEAAAGVLAAAGQTLCYHNHHQEFRKLGGRTILERIYEGAPTLQGELDTYWVQYGGGDVAGWCSRLPGRLPLLHLKDYGVNAENKPFYCEIGNGNLDFRKIIPAAEASGCQWFIVEQDETPGDPVDSLAESFRHLTTHLVEA
jgi:sugar phosphate isomerase/epimerase